MKIRTLGWVVVGASLAAMTAGPALGVNSYVSITGTMAAPSPSVSTYFTVPASSSLTLKTLANGGGTNAAGATIGSGGIDSVLNLYTGGGSPLASNDDYNWPPYRDSRIIWGGASGDYRLDMRAFSDAALGNGTWALDLVNSTGWMTVTSLPTAGTVTVGALALGSDTVNGSAFQLNAGTLTLDWGLTLNSGGRFAMAGGTLVSHGDIAVSGGASGGRFALTSGTLLLSPGTGMNVSNGGQASFSSAFVLPTNTHLAAHSGALVTLSGGLTVAESAGTSGWLTVDGGAQVNAPGQNILIGDFGSGTATVSGGGVVTGGSLWLSMWAPSSGALTVTDPTSLVSLTTECTVGGNNGATGTLNVQAGGHLEAPQVRIGAAIGSTGQATIDGAGSLLKATTALAVGESGTATLNITGGASVQAGQVYAPSMGSGQGTINLSGLGSSLTATGLTVGIDNATTEFGTVNVGGGTTLTCSGPLNVRKNGLVHIQGGAVSVDTFNPDGGQVWLRYGSLNISGGVTLDGASLDFGGDIDFTKSLTVGGTTTLLTPMRVTGGTFLTGSLLNPGMLQFTGGTFGLTVDPVVVGGGGVLGSAVTIDAPKTLKASAGLNVAAGGLLRVDGGRVYAGAITNASGGTISVGGPASILSGTSLLNQGVIAGSGRITAPLTNAATGIVRVSGSESLTFDGASHANQGEIDVLYGATAEFVGPLTNQTSGFIVAQGNLVTRGGLTNQGAIAVSAGSANFLGGDVTNASGGRIIISGGATATFYDDVVHNAGALFRTSAGCKTVFFGSLSGTGSFDGGGTIYNEGDLRPGASPAEVGFEGNLVLGGGSALIAELAGTTPGSQYDVLNVAGGLSIDGRLDVELLYGFQPEAGQAFDILDWGTLEGTFDSVSLPALGGGLAWDTTNLYTTGALTVVPEPATLALVALGLAGIAGRRLRRAAHRQ